MGDMSWIEIIYWASTIIGGTLFLLRTIMMLAGGALDGADDFDAGFDTDFDGHFDVDTHMDIDADHAGGVADSDFSFKLLSMQGLTAFFMMFGLVGLALLRAGLMTFLTIGGGITAGLFSVLVISIVFSQMFRLQSDGTIDIQNAVGQSGSVYLGIPVQGTGQVQVPVQGALKILDAVSTDGQRLETGEKIRVTGIVDNNTLLVEKKNTTI